MSEKKVKSMGINEKINDESVKTKTESKPEIKPEIKIIAKETIKPDLSGFKLVKIPQGIFKDIYGRTDLLADRMAWCNKTVYDVIKQIETSELRNRIIITDIYRLPSESYLARKKKGNLVAPCGLSGHNYGISIDIDCAGTAKALGILEVRLKEILGQHKLYNIQREAWHYNILYSIESNYFYRFWDDLTSEVQKHIGEIFIKRFNLVNKTDHKTIKDVQLFLGLDADGVMGKRTYLSATMLMAERMKMLDIMSKEPELDVNFTKVWYE